MSALGSDPDLKTCCWSKRETGHLPGRSPWKKDKYRPLTSCYPLDPIGAIGDLANSNYFIKELRVAFLV